MFNQNQLNAVASTTPTAPTTPPAPEGDKASLDNTDIYYMPENFQKNNQVAGKNNNIKGVWVLVAAIIFLGLMGGGLYVYWQHPDALSGLLNRQSENTTPQPEAQAPASTDTNLTPAPAARPSGSPKEIYLVFRSELGLATTVDAYLSVYSRYATTALYNQLTAKRSQLEAAGASADILTALRGSALPVLDGTETIQENITDTQAVVNIVLASSQETGRIVFIPENGQWKLSEETWQGPQAPAGGETAIGQDDDQDGLTNAEEAAVGTNAKASDSDGDGYADLSEINNGYNPTGEGKLEADKSLATYLNTTFNFSLLYPADWNRTIATSDDSVILTAPNKQFVQVLIQPNTDREDIVSWYKKTFSVETVPATQMITTDGWDGVRAADGQTAYLTNKDKSYVFVVTYNLGGSRILEYKNIFELILRSLKLAA